MTNSRGMCLESLGIEILRQYNGIVDGSWRTGYVMDDYEWSRDYRWSRNIWIEVRVFSRRDKDPLNLLSMKIGRRVKAEHLCSVSRDVSLRNIGAISFKL